MGMCACVGVVPRLGGEPRGLYRGLSSPRMFETPFVVIACEGVSVLQNL